jgi:hypothetical protein
MYVRPESFTVSIKGECQFSANDKRKLSAASRIGFWGCWLFFEQVSMASKTSSHQFFLQKLLSKLNLPSYYISRSSLSAKHYARLCRVICKLNATENE